MTRDDSPRDPATLVQYVLDSLAVLIAAGAEPEDTSWRRVDDLWLHSLDAAMVFVRAAAERRGATVAAICNELRATECDRRAPL